MADYEFSVADNCVIRQNGSYRLSFYGGEGMDGKRHFSAVWTGSVAAAGILAFSFDGNPGDPPATMDLGGRDNAFSWNVRVPFVDVAVSGLPANGAVTLYFR